MFSIISPCGNFHSFTSSLQFILFNCFNYFINCVYTTLALQYQIYILCVLHTRPILLKIWPKKWIERFYYICCNTVCCGLVYLLFLIWSYRRVQWNNLNWNWLQNLFDQFDLCQECTVHVCIVRIILIFDRWVYPYIEYTNFIELFFSYLNVFLNVQWKYFKLQLMQVVHSLIT